MKKLPTYYQAIRYLCDCNPARQRSLNLIEQERISKPAKEVYDDENPERRWSAVCCCVRRGLSTWTNEQKAVWDLCERGIQGYRYHPQEAATWLGCSSRTVYRWLEKMREDIECELKSRGLLEIEEN